MDALYYIDLAQLNRLREIAVLLEEKNSDPAETNADLAADLKKIVASAEKAVAFEF